MTNETLTNIGIMLFAGIIIFWLWKKGWFRPNRFL